ncbi:MAG: ATP-grasp domain-containing protein [Robiginitomaculum sp.]|nr:ATP-grasp domain-containing protein [Robiginitomaculum sp.]
MNKPFQKILIANRGEIACGIMGTAKAMGLRTIAVYSDVDRDALHVKLADEAVHIGAAPAPRSYLDIGGILAAAKSSGAEAVHPGYGFLSENAEFARACKEAGLVFIGPSSEVMEIMGDKAKAKSTMLKAGVVCIPGYLEADQSLGALRAAAKSIGFPLMVKAAAGGGGMGMRLVAGLQDFEAAVNEAKREAESAFGSGALILEKALVGARHIEVQVFADTHGNTIHLGERDCSVQRRNQKIIEEAPAPGLSKKLRVAMGAAAIQVAKAVGYVGAGTVEFLLADGDFYFLEMNTRLQVEHPVTEAITAADLVEMQINVAQGLPLSLCQKDVQFNGHAIEARIYAEDPSAGFLPASGRIEVFAPGGEARVDTGVIAGSVVPSDYDPLVAKIIAHGNSRETARRKLLDALRGAALFGLTTNIGFLTRVLADEDYTKGGVDTGFVETHKQKFNTPKITMDILTSAVAVQFDLDFEASRSKSLFPNTPPTHWSSAAALSTPYQFLVGDDEYSFHGASNGERGYHIGCAGNVWNVALIERTDHKVVLRVNGRKQSLFYYPLSPSHLQIGSGGHVYDIHDQNKMFAAASTAQNDGQILAPMHGNMAEIFVKAGDVVADGDRLGVLEAMKMRHEIVAPVGGDITEIFVIAGEQVSSGAALFTVEPKAKP